MCVCARKCQKGAYCDEFRGHQFVERAGGGWERRDPIQVRNDPNLQFERVFEGKIFEEAVP